MVDLDPHPFKTSGASAIEPLPLYLRMSVGIVTGGEIGMLAFRSFSCTTAVSFATCCVSPQDPLQKCQAVMGAGPGFKSKRVWVKILRQSRLSPHEVQELLLGVTRV